VALVIGGALCVLAPIVSAQQDDNATNDRWGVLTYFVGKWVGEGSGLGGASSVTHRFETVMDGQFIRWTTTSVTKPEEANPEGETHEDIGFISFDELRTRYVLRQFLSEGYVNTYELVSTGDDGRTLTFETVDVEGLPDGWRARMTLAIKGETTFVWHLELGPPEQDYFECRTGQMERDN